MFFCIGSILDDIYIDIDDQYLTRLNIVKSSWTCVDDDQIKSHMSKLPPPRHRDLGGSAWNTTRILKNLGVQTSQLECMSKNKGKCLVLQTQDKERTFITSLSNSQEIHITSIDLDQIKKSNFLIIEGYLLSNEKSYLTIIKLLNTIQNDSINIILTLGDSKLITKHYLKIQKILNEYNCILFGNQKEFKTLNKYTRYKVEEKHSCYKTLGHKGATHSELQEIIPAVNVKPIDKNGAGDSFAAGVILSMIHKLPLKKEIELGLFLSSITITQPVSTPIISPSDCLKIKHIITS